MLPDENSDHDRYTESDLSSASAPSRRAGLHPHGVVGRPGETQSVGVGGDEGAAHEPPVLVWEVSAACW